MRFLWMLQHNCSLAGNQDQKKCMYTASAPAILVLLVESLPKPFSLFAYVPTPVYKVDSYILDSGYKYVYFATDTEYEGMP